MYSKEFHTRRKTNLKYNHLLKGLYAVVDFSKIEKVCDVGCSVGVILGALQSKYKDIKYYGMDGYAPEEELAYTGEFDRVDLNKGRLTDWGKMDLLICQEVFEHLEPGNMQNALDTLTLLSKEGTQLVFSAAPPGQRGTHHINCREKAEWRRMLEKQGWVYDYKKTGEYKKTLRKSGIDVKDCYFKNSMVFRFTNQKRIHLDISIQCHNFQIRTNWMLSSIHQQEGILPIIDITISCVKNNGCPTTEEIVKYFREVCGMNIKLHLYDGIEEFQYRGLTRNKAIKETEADFIMFADADMVYPPNFMSKANQLLGYEFADSDNCMYGQRFSTDLTDTEKLLTKFKYPSEVGFCYRRASKLGGQLRSNVGAGYCQIYNVDKVRAEHEGLYQPEGKRLDWSWEKKYQKAKSDTYLRRKTGKRAIPLPVQIHLQHDRPKEVGKMLWNQR